MKELPIWCLVRFLDTCLFEVASCSGSWWRNSLELSFIRALISFFKIYLFVLRERERDRNRDRELGRVRERERETESQALSVQSPIQGSNSLTLRSWPELKSIVNSWMLTDWATQAPLISFLITSQKPYIHIPSHWELGFNNGFRGDINIKSIAHTNWKFSVFIYL